MTVVAIRETGPSKETSTPRWSVTVNPAEALFAAPLLSWVSREEQPTSAAPPATATPPAPNSFSRRRREAPGGAVRSCAGEPSSGSGGTGADMAEPPERNLE